MPDHLFSPITLGGLDLPNRIAIAPMCQYSADDGSAIRLAPAAMDDVRAVRRRHGHDGDVRRRAARPHLAWLPRPLFRPQRGGGEARAGRRAAGRAFRHEVRHPARPCRAQGVMPASLGRRRPAEARTGPVADRLGLGPAFRRRLAHAACADRGRDPGADRRFRQGRPSRRARRLRLHRAAFGARLSAAPVHLAAVQPAQRPLGRLVREPHPAGRRDRPAGQEGRAEADARRAHLGNRLGRRRIERRGRHRTRPRAEGCRRVLHLLLERRQLAAAEDTDRTRVPGASGRSREEGGRHSGSRGRHDRRAEAGRGDRRRGRADMVAMARAILADPRWPWRAAATLGHEFKTAPQLARAAHLPKQWVAA